MNKYKFILIGNLLFFKPGQISPSPVWFVCILLTRKYTIYIFYITLYVRVNVEPWWEQEKSSSSYYEYEEEPEEGGIKAPSINLYNTFLNKVESGGKAEKSVSPLSAEISNCLTAV